MRQLWKYVSEQHGNAKITINCSDGSLIETDDLDTLVTFPNTRHRRILGVSLISGFNLPSRVTIEIDGSNGAKIRYQIVGEDKDVVFLSERISEVLRASFTWYSPIIGPPWHSIFGIWLISVLAISIYADYEALNR